MLPIHQVFVFVCVCVCEGALFFVKSGGLQPGDVVEAVGLVHATEFNHKVGTVVKFAEALGRWVVRLPDDAGEEVLKNLLPSNLKFLRHAAAASSGVGSTAASSGSGNGPLAQLEPPRPVRGWTGPRTRPGDRKVILKGREFSELKRGRNTKQV